MKSRISIFFVFLLCVSFSADAQKKKDKNKKGAEPVKSETEKIETVKGLKDYYAKYFDIGVAISPFSIQGDEAALIVREFNSVTAENAMKMGPIQPKPGEYNWSQPDAMVEFAVNNNLKMRGHTLLWHSQAPRWIFTNENGDTVSRDVLLERLRTHIHTVVGRYKGKIYAWDAANEVISDKKDEFYRPSPWLKIIGDDFVAKAFEYAHEADPNALLFYNDYNEIDPVKRQKIYKMVSDLKAKGVPIHGIGLQSHWAVNEPTYTQLDETLKLFASTGLQLQITELDISVYAKEHDRRDPKPEDADTAFTPEKEQKQIEQYKMCFELFRKYKDNITSVTFWNVSDRFTWLDNFPVRNRKDYPLLFDKDYQRKKAYAEVVKF
jgi:endo-1,4-beta-xylanase